MNRKEIEQALRDYNWMINVIAKYREENYIRGGNIVSVIDDMPKASGMTSDPVAMEVIRRDRNSRWVDELSEKVRYIQDRIPLITDIREKAVLNMILDGMSMSAIGKHMGLSRRHIYTIKESIISQFAQK